MHVKVFCLARYIALKVNIRLSDPENSIQTSIQTDNIRYKQTILALKQVSQSAWIYIKIKGILNSKTELVRKNTAALISLDSPPSQAAGIVDTTLTFRLDLFNMICIS